MRRDGAQFRLVFANANVGNEGREGINLSIPKFG